MLNYQIEHTDGMINVVGSRIELYAYLDKVWGQGTYLIETTDGPMRMHVHRKRGPTLADVTGDGQHVADVVILTSEECER